MSDFKPKTYRGANGVATHTMDAIHKKKKSVASKMIKVNHYQKAAPEYIHHK